MPLFDYKCNKCGHTIEILTSFSMADGGEKVPKTCPACKCENTFKKMFNGKGLGIDFVGKGFYINDYGRHNYKRNMTPADQASVLLGEKDPY